MKFATIALLSTASALHLENKLTTSSANATTLNVKVENEVYVKAGTPAWDCSNSMYPTHSSHCWADMAYQTCKGPYNANWAYDAVKQAGGAGQKAYELLQALEKNNCGKCDVSKAGCENSMWKDANKPDCWAAEAYQKCPNARQQSYDAINKAGGNTPLAYCYLQALIDTSCAMKFVVAP